MTWDAHRHEVLRAVIEEANLRRDGQLPMDLPDVVDTFGDELTLIGALQMRWHTRLAGHIERALAEQPSDLEAAVLVAWVATAQELVGARRILDHYALVPTDEEMSSAMSKARQKEWALLAAMAGLASAQDSAAIGIGRALEQRARAVYDTQPFPATPLTAEGPDDRHPGRHSGHHESLLGRLKAVLAA
jgi:hypothetical protein